MVSRIYLKIYDSQQISVIENRVNFDRWDPYCLVVIISDLFYGRNVG